MLVMHLFEGNRKRLWQRVFFVLIFLFLTVVFGSNRANAGTPPAIITYQGKLLVNGTPATTMQSVLFMIYDAPTGGNVLYTANGSVNAPMSIPVNPSNGLFVVNLGGAGTNPLDPTIFKTTSTLYLQINVGIEALSPRKQLTTAPFAFNSTYLNGVASSATPSTSTYIPVSDANGNFSFNGVTSTALNVVGILTANGTTTLQGTFAAGNNSRAQGVNSVALGEQMTVNGADSFGINLDPAASPIINGSNIFAVLGGSVGIGTTTPSEALSVAGNISATGSIRAGAGIVAYSFSSDGDLFFDAHNGIGAVHFNAVSTTFSNSNLLATGLSHLSIDDGVPTFTLSGTTLSPGTGDMMLWDTRNAAFRAGYVTTNSPQAWDGANVGFGSAAFGIDNTARGIATFAAGLGNTVSSSFGTAFGRQNTITTFGDASLAAGSQNTIDAGTSFAFGDQNTITSGAGNSYAFGSNITINSGSGYDMGINLSSDPFTLSQNNTLAIMGGNVGIGTTNPQATLTVSGTSQLGTIIGNSSFTGDNVFTGTTTFSKVLFVPPDPSFLSSSTPLAVTNPGGMVVQGKFAYITAANEPTGSLLVYDISSQASPVLIGSTTFRHVEKSLGKSGGPIAVAGSNVYIGTTDYDGSTGTTTLLTFDITDPHNPQPTGQKVISAGPTLGNTPSSITVIGRFLFISDSLGLHIIDIGDSQNPHQLGLYSDSNAENFTIAGRYAYLGLSHNAPTPGLSIVDISNQANPTQVGFLSTGAGNGVLSSALSGKYLYLAAGGNILVVDVSDPTSPTVVHTISGFSAGGAVVVGNYLYVAKVGGTQFEIFNINDPVNPVLIRTTTAAQGASLTFVGHYAYVMSTTTLSILDLGGADISSASIGSLAANNAYVSGDASFGNRVTVGLGLNVGVAGIQTDGSIAVAGGGTSSSIMTALGIGTATPSSMLTVVGDIHATGNITCDGTCGGGIWQLNGTSTYYTGGNVGIGTSTPQSALVVIGSGSIGGSNVVSGQSTFASGDTNTITGNYSVGFGSGNSASGDYAFVGGSGSTASGILAMAYGLNAQATGISSVALGNGLHATGQDSLALGDVSNASGFDAVAIGLLNNASGQGSFALGQHMTVTGVGSFGIGLSSTPATVSQDNVLAIMGGNVGIGTAAPEFPLSLGGDGSIIAVGSSQFDHNSFAITSTGAVLNTSGPGDKMIWYARQAAFRAGYTEGDDWDNANIGFGSVALGVDNRATAFASFSSGVNSKAEGMISTAIGSGMHVTATNTVGIGLDVGQEFEADQPNSFVVMGGNVGIGTTAPSNVLTVVGSANFGELTSANIVTSTDSYAFGDNNIINAQLSLAAGYNNTINGGGAGMAFGHDNTIYGSGVALGSYNAALADAAFSIGFTNTSSVHGSFTYGLNNTASSQGAMAFGTNMIVSGTSSIGIGLYNYSTSSPNTFATLAQSNTFAIMGGNVGIGTTTPSSTLTVVGSGNFGNVNAPNFVAGTDAFAIGDANTANGTNAIAIGTQNSALGSYTTAIGFNNTSYALGSVAFGSGNMVSTSGYYSLVAGDNNIANGLASIALGDHVSALAQLSIAMGNHIVVSGNNSFGLNLSPDDSYTLTQTSTFAVVGGNMGVGTTSPQAKLHLYDGTLLVDNPRHPTVAGNLATSGSDFRIAVSGKYAYIIDNSKLDVVDISSAATPTLVSSSTLAGTGQGLAISGKYAYVAVFDKGIQVIDISNPASPRSVGTNSTGYSLGGGIMALGIAVSGKTAYVGTTYGFADYDISDPTAPRFMASSTTVTDVTRIAISGRYAYLSGSINAWAIADISNPASPTIASTVSLGGVDPEDVYVSGKYLYVAVDKVTTTGTLRIYDISSSTHAVLVGSVSTPDSAKGIKVAGKYAYVTSLGGSLTVVDVSTPSNPSVVATLSLTGNAFDLAAAGKYLYVATGSGGLNVIDVEGADVSTASVGDVAANHLTVWENADVGDLLNVGTGLNVGLGGISSNGPIGVYALGGVSTFLGQTLFGTTTPPATAYSVFINAGSSTTPALGVNGYIKASGFITGSTTLDLAETYPVDQTCQATNSCPAPADLVCLSPLGNGAVAQCDTSNNKNVLGIVSTDPGFTLGDASDATSVRVALAGRVPVRVSTANGSITIGDYLTASTVPGVAVKAGSGDPIVGRALQNYTASTVGMIVAFVQNNQGAAFSLPTTTVQTSFMGGSLTDAIQSMGITIQQGIIHAENWILSIKKLIVDSIEAKNVKTNELCLNNTCVTEQELQLLLQKNGLNSAAAPSDGGDTQNSTPSPQPQPSAPPVTDTTSTVDTTTTDAAAPSAPVDATSQGDSSPDVSQAPAGSSAPADTTSAPDTTGSDDAASQPSVQPSTDTVTPAPAAPDATATAPAGDASGGA